MQISISRYPQTRIRLLALVFSFTLGCPSGDKGGDDSAKSAVEGEDSGDCGMSTTTLTVSLVSEDEYAETFFERYPDKQTLEVYVKSLAAGPESDKHCITMDGTSMGEMLVDLGTSVEIEVPVGWVCGWVKIKEVIPVLGSGGDYITCNGEMVPIEVSGCGPTSTSIVVGCGYEFGADYGDLHTAPREGSLQVGAGLPDPQTERHLAPPRWRSSP